MFHKGVLMLVQKQVSPISVLVMDSNPAFLRFVVQYLEEQHGETVRVAGAAFRTTDALALAAFTNPQVAIIGMSEPIYNALSLIAEIRQRSPSLHVVAMSQLGAAGYAQAALAAGAAAFVDKDRLRAELLPAILETIL